MHQTKFKFKKTKQRAVTQNLGKQELRFLCIALCLDEIYPPAKFHNHSQYSLRYAPEKIQVLKKQQRAKTQKLSEQELMFMCTALLLDEIYQPTKFHNHSWYSFGDLLRTKIKYVNKQRAIIQKLNKR